MSGHLLCCVKTYKLETWRVTDLNISFQANKQLVNKKDEYQPPMVPMEQNTLYKDEYTFKVLLLYLLSLHFWEYRST